MRRKKFRYSNEALNLRLRLVYVTSPTDFRANDLDRLTCTCQPFLKAANLDRKMAIMAIVAEASLARAEVVLQ